MNDDEKIMEQRELDLLKMIITNRYETYKISLHGLTKLLQFLSSYTMQAHIKKTPEAKKVYSDQMAAFEIINKIFNEKKLEEGEQYGTGQQPAQGELQSDKKDLGAKRDSA